MSVALHDAVEGNNAAAARRKKKVAQVHANTAVCMFMVYGRMYVVLNCFSLLCTIVFIIYDKYDAVQNAVVFGRHLLAPNSCLLCVLCLVVL